jgi:outer membrane receptor protein involved in Fe transport
MSKNRFWKTALLGSAIAALATAPGFAADVNVRPGDLGTALDSFIDQTGMHVFYSAKDIKGVITKGVRGDLSNDAALDQLLSDTGFISHKDGAVIEIVKGRSSSAVDIVPMQLAQATPPRAAVETVTVTSSKLGGADVQSIPIAITALSQEQLTATQTAGGPDLVKQVPNLTFTKTNFTGYSIQIRGIGTQDISVTTDPAVAVALNDIPFIRNHFFEQEFYDLGQVEVLRGPQGTLYGRNATAGVVNLTTARPTDQFEAMVSGEIGNYHQKRFEGMINLPIVDDRLDIRLAGEWTKRQGYSFNESTDSRIDGRDLWSGRLSIGIKPFEDLQLNLVWEHFSEDDDRMRTAKQLCKHDPGPQSVDGVPLPLGGTVANPFLFSTNYLSQGCLPASLYAPESFGVPNGYSLPYVAAIQFVGFNNVNVDPYAETSQSRNLRVMQSAIDPIYKAKNDTAELNADYRITPELTITSQTGFSTDFLYSTEDYNRFNTSPGIFIHQGSDVFTSSLVDTNGVFCDPQLGCSDRLVAQDVSEEHAWQLSQEFRLASHFAGPLNFSFGGNYLHYETEENYFVFINALSLFSLSSATVRTPELSGTPYIPGVTDKHQCLLGGFHYSSPSLGGGVPTENCIYVDPNPLAEINDNGHNYFLSQNPYVLNSYAAFGEAYYNITNDIKLTAGLRFTEDQKHFPQIPSWVVANGWGYPVTGIVDQQWDQFTGRFAANWTPKLDFTDQTLIYGSYAHGYKAGGANPPGPILDSSGSAGDPGGGAIATPVHPLTFEPEFVDAFEVGSKNTLLDGGLTLNGSAFYYNYEHYQISQIVDRTSINLNFDAHVKGAELEATYEPIPGLRFNFAGGWEDTELAKGTQAIDLMNRTASTPGWSVVKPFATQAANCVLPNYVVAALMQLSAQNNGSEGATEPLACGVAYNGGFDPVTDAIFDPTTDLILPDGTHYHGFDPLTAPNNGEGFAKDLGGDELPNAPRFTVSAGAQYTVPLTPDWAGTLRGDFYWQDASWARVWNDDPYDRIHGYTNLNLTLIFTSQAGWQVMLYDKNVFNTTAITGTFLNSDDTGLTTNVFLTDPKLIGVRVTKNW